MSEGYKMTELGEIPNQWMIEELNQVTNYVDYRGKTPSKVKNGIFLVTAKNIKNGKINYLNSVEYVPEDEYKNIMGRGLPQIGDVLITTEAPLGEVATIDRENIALAQRIIKYRGKEKILRNDYLKYAFLSDYFQENLEKESTGSTVKGIKGSRLHKQKVLIPTLTEQQKIAEILTTVDEKIDIIDAQINQTQELKKGLMQQLLTKGIGHTQFKDSPLGEIPETWVVQKISDFADVISGGTPNTSIAEYWGGNILWMNSGEINQKTIRSVVGRITDEGFKNSSTKLIPVNSILIALAGQGTTRGKVAINLIELCVNQSLGVIMNLKNVHHQFLFHNLQHRYLELRRMSTDDTGRGGLNLTIIKSILVATPSMKEQQKISSILCTLDSKIEILNNKKQNYLYLKKALMQQLLTGKIRVNHLIENEVHA